MVSLIVMAIVMATYLQNLLTKLIMQVTKNIMHVMQVSTIQHIIILVQILQLEWNHECLILKRLISTAFIFLPIYFHLLALEFSKVWCFKVRRGVYGYFRKNSHTSMALSMIMVGLVLFGLTANLTRQTRPVAWKSLWMPKIKGTDLEAMANVRSVWYF